MISRLKPTVFELLFLALGVFLILRYAWLMDDAFVYFRYIDNWVFLHFGPVYNQGEYVEGYSSPLWLLILSGLRWSGVNFWIAVQGIAVLAFFLFWAGLVIIDRTIVPNGNNGLNFPLVYLVSTYAVLCYFTSGLETPLVQLCAVAYALFVFYPRSRLLEAAVALSPLVRQELILPLGILFLWSWKSQRRFPSMLFLLSLLCVGGWIIFRVWYYADFFPNTYYLKDTIDIRQGLVYLNDTALPYYLYWFAALYLAVTLWLWGTKRPAEKLLLPERAVMLLCAAPVLAYVIKIGGDPRHYRYLAFPVCLSVCAVSGLLETALARIRAPKFSGICAAGLLAVIVLAAYPRQLLDHPFWLAEKQRRVDLINDASAHRRHKDLLYSSWSQKINEQILLAYRERAGEKFYRKIEPLWWCATAYKRFDVRVVHSLGLTDAFLGRSDAEINRPAHRWGLLEMANDMVKIESAASAVGPGMFRQAVAAKRAPDWVIKNLVSIEVIERKVFNRHDFGENLALAFSFPPKIVPYGVRAPKGHGGGEASENDSDDAADDTDQQ